MENINYMSNFNNSQQKNAVYGNTYNPSWRNHPNLCWSNQGSNQWRPQAPLGFGGQNAYHQNQPHFQQAKTLFSSSSLESKNEKNSWI